MGMKSCYAKYTASSREANALSAVVDVEKQLSGFSPKQVIFFAAENYDAATLASAMRDTFPGAVTFGCSSSGEIVNGEMFSGSLAVMAFDDEVFDFFDITLLRRLNDDGGSNNPSRQVEEAFARFEAKLGQSMATLEYDKYVGLILADGLRYYVEPVLDRAGDLTSVPFIGGLAGDDGAFLFTPVFFDGQVYTDAVVMALVKPAGKFTILKTQGLKVLDTVFTVTGSDEERRLVTHLDGRPAATVYREAIGVVDESLDFATTFSQWPLSLMVGDEPFLRVAVEQMPDGSLRFLNAVKEGMRLKLSRPADILDTTRAAMAELHRRFAPISGLLHINCLSRHHALADAGECEAFGALFTGYPNTGFSSHGECYIAIANQTSTMLVFG